MYSIDTIEKKTTTFSHAELERYLINGRMESSRNVIYMQREHKKRSLAFEVLKQLLNKYKPFLEITGDKFKIINNGYNCFKELENSVTGDRVSAQEVLNELKRLQEQK